MRAYGASKLTVVDRFGVYLSERPIRNAVSRYDSPDVLDVGCGYDGHALARTRPIIGSGGNRFGDQRRRQDTPKLRFLEGTAEEKLTTLQAASFDVG